MDKSKLHRVLKAAGYVVEVVDDFDDEDYDEAILFTDDDKGYSIREKPKEPEKIEVLHLVDCGTMDIALKVNELVKVVNELKKK